MSSHPLDGAYAKLGRARAHVKALELAMDHFMGERKPYEVVSENDAAAGELVCKIRIYEQPPAQWSLLVGDTLQNVRAALNYLACELTTLNLGPGADLRDRAYPIFVEPAPESSWERCIGGLNEAQRALLERTQPYTRTQPNQFDPFEVLQGLANVDQQRALIRTWIGLRKFDFPRNLVALVGQPNFGPFEDGAELARFRFIVGPQANMKVNTNFAFGITLTDPISGSPMSVRSMVGAIHDRAANVLDACKTFFA
jgi:hypothetical protein